MYGMKEQNEMFKTKSCGMVALRELIEDIRSDVTSGVAKQDEKIRSARK